MSSQYNCEAAFQVSITAKLLWTLSATKMSRKNFWRFAGNREMEIDDGQDKWGDWEAGLDLGERIGRSPIVLRVRKTPSACQQC